MENFKQLKGGEIRVEGEPCRTLSWHRPRTTVRPVQWQPETGVTRYAWCRDRTPKSQLPFWEHLQRIYQAQIPVPLPPEVAEELNQLEGDLSEAKIAGFRETIAEHEIHSRDPSGEWVFMISAEFWRGALCDRLSVHCSDHHTLPDFELLLRFRSWVLTDDREAFMWLPDQPAGSLRRYENSAWNSLQLLSPRLMQKGGLLPSATQGNPE